jgi:hypothetical protein
MACLPCWLDRLRYLADLPANANTARRDEADDRPQHHPTAGRHMDGAAAEPHHRRHIFQESIAHHGERRGRGAISASTR